MQVEVGQQRIVGEADQKGLSAQTRPDLVREPAVEHFVQVEIRQQRADDASNNVAKLGLELTVSIDRIQLKGSYREGFGGAPLRIAPPADRPATGKRDNGRGEEATQGASRTGDDDHV
jgi:hypothetical protein